MEDTKNNKIKTLAKYSAEGLIPATVALGVMYAITKNIGEKAIDDEINKLIDFVKQNNSLLDDSKKIISKYGDIIDNFDFEWNIQNNDESTKHITMIKDTQFISGHTRFNCTAKLTAETYTLDNVELITNSAGDTVGYWSSSENILFINGYGYQIQDINNYGDFVINVNGINRVLQYKYVDGHIISTKTDESSMIVDDEVYNLTPGSVTVLKPHTLSLLDDNNNVIKSDYVGYLTPASGGFIYGDNNIVFERVYNSSIIDQTIYSVEFDTQNGVLVDNIQLAKNNLVEQLNDIEKYATENNLDLDIDLAKRMSQIVKNMDVSEIKTYDEFLEKVQNAFTQANTDDLDFNYGFSKISEKLEDTSFFEKLSQAGVNNSGAIGVAVFSVLAIGVVASVVPLIDKTVNKIHKKNEKNKKAFLDI